MTLSLSRIRRGQDRAAMGWLHRCHARRRSRDLAGGTDSRLLHRHRLFGPWLRHRAGRRPADGRSGCRIDTDRRSATVPLVALLRRLDDRGHCRSLIRLLSTAVRQSLEFDGTLRRVSGALTKRLYRSTRRSRHHSASRQPTRAPPPTTRQNRPTDEPPQVMPIYQAPRQR